MGIQGRPTEDAASDSADIARCRSAPTADTSAVTTWMTLASPNHRVKVSDQDSAGSIPFLEGQNAQAANHGPEHLDVRPRVEGSTGKKLVDRFPPWLICRVFKSQAWGPIPPILKNCATGLARYLRPSSSLNSWITP